MQYDWYMPLLMSYQNNENVELATVPILVSDTQMPFSRDTIA